MATDGAPALFPTIAGFRDCLAEWRAAGLRIGLVPTMGNLHDGHIALVRQVAEHCDRVAVTVFVNPLQFVQGEDFDDYPRTLQADRERLAAESAHALFCPSVGEMYPADGISQTQVHVPNLENILCGAHRPGHFSGVATVVAKLLNIAQPDVAIFGRKDYQQLVVIRQLVHDLSFPVEIIAAPTLRHEDGLAMSSRNQYLTDEERRVAPMLYARIDGIRQAIVAGERDYAMLCKRAIDALTDAGFRTDYVSVLDAADLQAPSAKTRRLAVLTAARLSRARLIDNVVVDLP